MQTQAQKMWVMEKGKYAILFLADTNRDTQVYCSVSGDGDASQIHFDGTGTPPNLIQWLTTSAVWGQAIRTFHTVSAKSYTVTGKNAPPWGDIPVQLREIEVESYDECQLQFVEPDAGPKFIHVKFTIMNSGSNPMPGYDITGDKTVISRLYIRDILQLTDDFFSCRSRIMMETHAGYT